jgi:ubiquinone/menaquinone biosynthesis C-methylase UbiE
MPVEDRFLEDIFQYRKAIVLFSAMETGLLEYLSENGAVRAEEVAEQFSWDRRGAEIFLNALCALGYFQKNDSKYFFSNRLEEQIDFTNNLLFQEWMLHEWRLLNRWIHLPEVLRTGTPYREPEKKTEQQNHRNFILSMAHREQLNADSLLKVVDLSGYQHLLDLGGGPGLFSIAFVKKYPQLQATVFDTPDTEAIALDFFNNSGIINRLKFAKGDFLIDDIGSHYDVALLSSILHIYGPEQNVQLLRRVHASLVSGGKIIIRDFALNNNKTGPVIGSLFAVNMLINTERGNAYTYTEMRTWLKEAGFIKMRRTNLEGGILLLEASKK